MKITLRFVSLFTILLMMLMMPESPLFAQGSPTDDGDNWMRRLPDNTYVAAISIPGTHDTATGEGFGEDGSLGEEYARCQDLSIAQQWNVGVRAFDLRPAAFEGYLNCNHGMIATSKRFDDALKQIRDLLIANPSEFVIIHMLHASDGDMTDDYNTQILQLLHSDELKDYLVNFKKDLQVADVRGKMLILSRDKYAGTPVGGFFDNWTGSADWTYMTRPTIIGTGTNSSKVYVQDYSETYKEGDLDIKIAAMKRLLNYGATHKNKTKASLVWYFNFASAYSKVISLFGYEISTSDGYRDNATHTHAAMLDFLSSTEYFGPTGVVLMDYAGVDQSGEYKTRGRELVKAIIAHNFTYLDDVVAGIPATKIDGSEAKVEAFYSIDGARLASPQHNAVNIVRYSDGKSRKVLY